MIFKIKSTHIARRSIPLSSIRIKYGGCNSSKSALIINFV